MSRTIKLLMVTAMILVAAACNKDDGIHLTINMVKGKWVINDPQFDQDWTYMLIYADSTYYITEDHKFSNEKGHTTTSGKLIIEGNTLYLNNRRDEFIKFYEYENGTNDKAIVEFFGQQMRYKESSVTRISKDLSIGTYLDTDKAK